MGRNIWLLPVVLALLLSGCRKTDPLPAAAMAETVETTQVTETKAETEERCLPGLRFTPQRIDSQGVRSQRWSISRNLRSQLLRMI